MSEYARGGPSSDDVNYPIRHASFMERLELHFELHPPKLELFANTMREIEEKRGISHVDGVPWFRAEKPPEQHECWAQTTGLGAKRCPCGAIAREGSDHWMERNAR